MIRSFFATLFIAAFALGGCTDDLSTVGSKFIPENERYSVKVDTSYEIKPYTLLNDSIRTDNFSAGLIGSMKNKFLGRTTASFASEIYPVDTSVLKPEYAPVFDTIYFTFSIDSYLGLKGKSMTVRINELTTVLDTGNLRSSYDFTGKYNTINLADTLISGTGTYVVFRIDGAAKQFGERLLTLNKLEKDSADAFRKKIFGLYFNVDPLEAEGAFYKITAASVTVKVKYHYTLGPNKNERKDTYFSFRNYEDTKDAVNPLGIKGKSNRVISIIHNLDEADMNLKPQKLGKIETDSVFYVSSMGGAMGILDFESYIDHHWRDSVPCVISRAELVIDYYKSADTEMDRIPTRLGLFQLDSRSRLIPIYDLFLESSYTSYSGVYNGTFQKGWMRYSANITRYFQTLLDNKTTLSRIYVLPVLTSSYQSVLDYNTVFYNDYSYGVFKGSTNSSPIKLIITYSKLKK